VKRLDGPNVKKGKNKKDLAEQVIEDIRRFKAQHKLDRLVQVAFEDSCHQNNPVPVSKEDFRRIFTESIHGPTP